MDIKKPQLVKVEAFADFFQSGIPGHIQGGSLEKMRVLQHPPTLSQFCNTFRAFLTLRHAATFRAAILALQQRAHDSLSK